MPDQSLCFYYNLFKELLPLCYHIRWQEQSGYRANKSACYLCDLFLKIHGDFQVPRTFGKLNERWILPDWLDTIPLERYPLLKVAIEQFDTILNTQIQRLSHRQDKHPDPRESAIGLPAPWSVSSFEGSSSHAYPDPFQNNSARKGPEVSSRPTFPFRKDPLSPLGDDLT